MKNEIRKRPAFFTALCILTFAGSSIGFIGYFLASLLFEKTAELIIKYSSWHSVDEISPMYFTVLMVLFAISLTGAIRMWKFHRDGFYLYAFSQLAILFLPAIWISWDSLSTANAIVSGLFISGYALSFKYYK